MNRGRCHNGKCPPETGPRENRSWGAGINEMPRYPETIGECEHCGRLDHHLVTGLCPVCRPRYCVLGQVRHRGNMRARIRTPQTCSLLKRQTT